MVVLVSIASTTVETATTIEAVINRPQTVRKLTEYDARPDTRALIVLRVKISQKVIKADKDLYFKMT